MTSSRAAVLLRLCCILAVLIGSTGMGAAMAGSDAITLANVGFAAPAAARHDPAGDRYLVANINGAPAAKDNNGFLSVVTPGGTLANLKWIEGGKQGAELHAPKGFAVSEDTLYVADIDTLRVFDRASGRPLKNILIAGAVLLQDVALAPDGSLYLADSGRDQDTGAIFRIENGTPRLVARGFGLLRPNGIAVLADGNLIVTPGIGSTLLTLSPAGKLLDMSAFPGMNLPFQPHSPGWLSGAVVLDDKTVLVSSREGKAVAYVRLNHDPALTSFTQYRPDITNTIMPGGTLAMTQEADRRRKAGTMVEVSPWDVNELATYDGGHAGLMKYFVPGASAESEFVLTGVSDPAKLGLDRAKRRVLVPQILSNALLIAPLPVTEGK